MARCGCSGTSGCSCVVTGGVGIEVNGSGTGADPYVIDASSTSITGTVRVADTPTVDMTLAGSGSLTDPYTISAEASLSVPDLSDVGAGTPTEGDTLLWDGTQWVYGPPSTGGGGAVVATNPGLIGDGSTTSPLGPDVSGVWGTAPLNTYGTNTLLGAPIYVDDAGQLRSQPLGVQLLGGGDARPDQYPGRVIIQDGLPYYSDGTTWQALETSPAGMVSMWATADAPAGWLLCDGRNVSRTTYARLFAAIGTAFGVGNGTSTFGLPDLASRFPYGGSGPVGATGGAATHTLSTSQMPNHRHSIPSHRHTTPDHRHQIPYQIQENTNRGDDTAFRVTDIANSSGGGGGSDRVGTTRTDGSSNTGYWSGYSGYSGSGSAVNHMPPYVTLNFIIKT